MQHFVEGQPTQNTPNPVTAGGKRKRTKSRPPPKERSSSSQPLSKRKKIASIDEPTEAAEQERQEAADTLLALSDIMPLPSESSQYTEAQTTPVKVKIQRHLDRKREVHTGTTISQPVFYGPVKCPSCSTCFKPTKKERALLKRQDFVDEIQKSDENCFRYTGFPNIQLLKQTFDWIEPTAKHIKLTAGKFRQIPGKAKNRKRTALSLFEEFLLTLIRIRRGYDTHHMGYLFGVAQSHASRIFNTWVNLMYHCFLPLLRWPSKNLVHQNMPASFAKYPKTRVIIDATEFHVEKPFRPVAQRSTWSNYKQSNTFKLLVGIMPSGAITFLSKLYSGCISDNSITERSGLIEKLSSGDDVMADRGFNIRHLLLPKNCTLNIPAFSKGKALSKKALVKSRRIARLRIHVERGIRRLKTFKILTGIIPLRLRFSLNQIILIVSVLVNLQKRLA